MIKPKNHTLNQNSFGSVTEISKNWYLIHTKVHNEKIANTNLLRLGIKTLYPELKKVHFRNNKKRTVVLPLFPGYLFCCFDWGREFRKVNYAHGVANIVRFGSIPARVEDSTIESIKSRMIDGSMALSSTHLHKGHEVLIEGGPFHGLEAIFDQEITGTQRVALLLKHVAYHARVTINRDQVQKANTKNGADYFGE